MVVVNEINHRGIRKEKDVAILVAESIVSQ
jgi:hypothetical protein